MSTSIVPESVRLAAKRGFARTTSQAYAATLSAGLPSAAAVVAFVDDDSPTKYVVAGITVLLALASPPLAGLRSYLDIVGKGIPEDYAGATEIVGSSTVGGDFVAESVVPVDPKAGPTTSG